MLIMTKREMKAVLTEAIDAELDSFLARNGFSRKATTLEYTRNCQDGNQFLVMYFDFHPTYQPTADSCIYPQVGACFPELNRVAHEMIEAGDLSPEAADI